jgi:hypothetical protein
MGPLLQLKFTHSPLNQRILSSTSVPFTFTTVQVPNLALTHKKRITVCVPPAFVGGRTHSPGGEGGGGSIFWKTRDIGLPSYSNNLFPHEPLSPMSYPILFLYPWTSHVASHLSVSVSRVQAPVTLRIQLK